MEDVSSNTKIYIVLKRNRKKSWRCTQRKEIVKLERRKAYQVLFMLTINLSLLKIKLEFRRRAVHNSELYTKENQNHNQ